MSDGPTTDSFFRNILDWCRENPNDCRMDYLEVQIDKDTLDNIAVALNLRPVAWHEEPCTHRCFDCDLLLCEPNPGCLGHVPGGKKEATDQ